MAALTDNFHGWKTLSNPAYAPLELETGVVVQMRRARCRIEVDLGWSPPDAAAADPNEEPADLHDRTGDSTRGGQR